MDLKKMKRGIKNLRHPHDTLAVSPKIYSMLLKHPEICDVDKEVKYIWGLKIVFCPFLRDDQYKWLDSRRHFSQDLFKPKEPDFNASDVCP